MTKQPSPGFSRTAKRRGYRTEIVISAVLRIGVLASLFCIVTGTAVIFFHHPEYFSSTTELHRMTQQGAVFPHTPGDALSGLRNMQGQAIVVTGLLLLIATPVMRVAVSILIFLHQRDRIFTIITITVLCFLLISFVLGYITR